MRLPGAIAVALFCVLSLVGCADQTASQASDVATDAVVAETVGDVVTPRGMTLDEIVGVWDIALHYDPAQPPSATVLDISAIEDGALTGTFYGTPFEEGRATLFRGEAIVSVVTSDNSGPYLTSGRLDADGGFSGQTFSVGRGFLMPWTATRRDKTAE